MQVRIPLKNRSAMSRDEIAEAIQNLIRFSLPGEIHSDVYVSLSERYPLQMGDYYGVTDYPFETMGHTDNCDGLPDIDFSGMTGFGSDEYSAEEEIDFHSENPSILVPLSQEEAELIRALRAMWPKEETETEEVSNLAEVYYRRLEEEGREVERQLMQRALSLKEEVDLFQNGYLDLRDLESYVDAMELSRETTKEIVELLDVCRETVLFLKLEGCSEYLTEEDRAVITEIKEGRR